MIRTLKFNLGSRINSLVIVTVLIWSLFITLGWATESMDTSTRPQQPTIAGDQAPEGSQAHLSAALPGDPLTEAMYESPLSPATTSADPIVSKTEPAVIATPEVAVVALSEPGRQCSHSGDSLNGSQNCVEKDQGGRFTESVSNWENFGDEKKEQNVSRYYDAGGNSLGEDTIRIKTSYRNSIDGQQQKTREHFDLVKQPPRGLISRDLIVKDYDSQGELKKITWAHYLEIGTRKAGLAHHAVLYYKDGKLISGFANQYKNGKVVDTLLNYNPEKNPNLRIEKTGIVKWANWIDHLIRQSGTPAV